MVGSRNFHLLAATLVCVLARPTPAAEDDAAHPGSAWRPDAVTTQREPLDEILVTARRRDELAQDVPLALSVIDGDEIDATGAYSLERLQYLDPSLHLFGYNPRTTSISIRSLGGNVGLTSDGLEGGVGVFLDQVYIGRVGATQFELVDIDRVEVLRGPQGTLYGRNTTAGAINIVTRPPGFETSEGIVEASLGDYGFQQFKASFSGPLRNDTIAGRISLSYTDRAGFMENVRTGEDVQDLNNIAVRGQLLVSPTTDIAIRLIADYARQKQNCCTVVSVGVFSELDNGAPVPNTFLARAARLDYQPLPFEPFERKVDADSPIGAEMDQRGLSMQIDLPLARNDLTSITAYRDWNWDPANDGDDTGVPVITRFQQGNRQDQFSQEFRVASRGERRVDYVAGLYLYRETVDGVTLIAYGAAAPEWFFAPGPAFPSAVADAALNGFAANSTSSAETRSDAVFGQTVWHISGAFDLTAGLRFTHERRLGHYERRQVAGPALVALTPEEAVAAQAIRDSFNGETAYAAEVEDDSLSGLVTLSYHTGSDALVYFTASRGHKAGGLNIRDFPSGFDPAVRSETVQHYEIGAKGTPFDDAVDLNIALYHTTVSDYQTSVLQSNPAGGSPIQYISNVPKARSRGIEINALWSPNDRFSLSAAASYADALYANYPNGPCPPEISLTPRSCELSGQPIPGAPKRSWTVTLQGQEPLSGELEGYWRFDHSQQSDLFTSVSDSRYSLVDAYGLSNFRIGLRRSDHSWDLMIWARNLFDEEYFQIVTGRSTGWIAGLPGDPRTVGLTFRRHF